MYGESKTMLISQVSCVSLIPLSNQALVSIVFICKCSPHLSSLSMSHQRLSSTSNLVFCIDLVNCLCSFACSYDRPVNHTSASFPLCQLTKWYDYQMNHLINQQRIFRLSSRDVKEKPCRFEVIPCRVGNEYTCPDPYMKSERDSR